MKTILELKDEITELAYAGKRAAANKNLALSRELEAKVRPLLIELAERTGVREFARLAEQGQRLHEKTQPLN